MKKKILYTSLVLIILLIGMYAFVGYKWNYGPFSRLHVIVTNKYPGNAKKFNLENVTETKNSPLSDKNLLFLGSSVTYGSASNGVSFADYIGKRTGSQIIKEAKSGTTLVDIDKSSYISRLQKIEKEKEIDLFICQLSTNDASKEKELGKISESYNINDFDTQTVAGAIEYIIGYAKDTWDCPVVFYTNPKYQNENYESMVDLLHTVSEKWDISVIDLWNNTDFNNLSDDERELYLADDIHPTQAGYLEWWTPVIENELSVALKK